MITKSSSPAVRSLADYRILLSSIINARSDYRDANALEAHLADPSTPAMSLAKVFDLGLEDIRLIYRSLHSNTQVMTLVESPFYPRRLMHQFASGLIKDWVAHPNYAHRLVHHDGVASRVIEFHATKGTCEYKCVMCLWSDKNELTYAGRRLDQNGLMTESDWADVLRQAHKLGARTVVFSGGGEPLLNKNLFHIVARAHELGYRTQLYTNGYALDTLCESDWHSLLAMEQVRFSIHSPNASTYDAIVNMPPRANALRRVSRNIEELLDRKRMAGSTVRVGIGFVAQPLNHSEVSAMADFAAGLKVDFFNLRCEEVDVTRLLSQRESATLIRQLIDVRDKSLNGSFGKTYVDISDNLTALMNGTRQSIRPTEECMIKHLRPTISPFGILAPCDLKAEPRFADDDHVFGNLHDESAITETLVRADQISIKANCRQCMPSGRTGNAIFNKLSGDYGAGIAFRDQPFFQSELAVAAV